MRFTFDRDAMVKEIAIAQEIISTKNALSILSNVLFIAENNTLAIKATDIKVNFETKIPVVIEEEGTTTIFCDKFMSILASLPPGEIEFIQEDIKVTIKPISKKVKFQLKSMASDKFPEFSSAENVPYFDVPADQFKEMITQTIFAVSDDETRYFMNGVFFEKKDDNLNLVSTDGRRLAFSSKALCQGITDFPSVIVPPKVLTAVLKRASSEGMISLAIVDKMIYIKFGNYHFSSVLLEGQFPNYQRVIPETQAHSFELQKSDLADALKRVALLVDQKARRVYFELNPGTLTITSQESDIGVAKEEIPCQYDGETVTIAMNYLYIDEPMKVMNCDRIKFEFTEPMRAVTLKPVPESDYFHIIMPMQME
ncbi:DNA polymerase III subunit beta [Treponema brennaborense]|uniref:Beta sliding clamp n=1 Tax=Treponema brennaborense (strain DSM 12168 / CIP 105900 / DD5/3) TaxID=906968 RepID=F4LK73_TREBD|nr:DNA polymerase III subunit beta [Treponema brennaborense]AEE15462.1 DNA polymerase III, beta subunit [Treponema brennaborense DSM 12168]